MMWRTFSTSTAYCMAERQLTSACTTTLATLRWTKSSPGGRPTISFAGTRLSEQPIQRYSGACCFVRRAKNCGSWRVMRSAQARLFAKSSLRKRKRENASVLRRRALLDEGVHSGAPLVVREARGNDAGGERVGLLEAKVHLLVERALAGRHGGGRLGRKQRCQPGNLRIEAVER